MTDVDERTRKQQLSISTSNEQ